MLLPMDMISFCRHWKNKPQGPEHSWICGGGDWLPSQTMHLMVGSNKIAGLSIPSSHKHAARSADAGKLKASSLSPYLWRTSGGGQKLLACCTTSTTLWPDSSRVIWDLDDKPLKAISFESVSITALVCSSSPIDNKWGTSSASTVSLIMPGLPPRKTGARAVNNGFASPPMPDAGGGAFLSTMALRPAAARRSWSARKAFSPIRSWAAPGSMMAKPGGTVR